MPQLDLFSSTEQHAASHMSLLHSSNCLQALGQRPHHTATTAPGSSRLLMRSARRSSGSCSSLPPSPLPPLPPLPPSEDAAPSLAPSCVRMCTCGGQTMRRDMGVWGVEGAFLYMHYKRFVASLKISSRENITTLLGKTWKTPDTPSEYGS